MERGTNCHAKTWLCCQPRHDEVQQSVQRLGWGVCVCGGGALQCHCPAQGASYCKVQHTETLQCRGVSDRWSGLEWRVANMQLFLIESAQSGRGAPVRAEWRALVVLLTVDGAPTSAPPGHITASTPRTRTLTHNPNTFWDNL